MPSSDDASAQTWFYRGLSEGLEATHTATPRAELAARIQSIADRLVAVSPDAANRECEAGCAACCHYPVGATRSEVTALAATLRQTLPPDALTALLADDGLSGEELVRVYRAFTGGAPEVASAEPNWWRGGGRR